MKRYINSVVALTILLTGIGIGLTLRLETPQAGAQTSSRYFPETRHTVKGRFLEYWAANGGLAQQGHPISDEFQETSDLNGRTYTVQYFERAVFEWHPENRPPYDVLLTQLGTLRFKEKYPNGQPGSPPPPAPTPTTMVRPPAGGRLAIESYTTFKDSANHPVLVGFARNTSGVDFAPATIHVLLKDAGGKTVGTAIARSPGILKSGDFWPFRAVFETYTPAYATADFEIDVTRASDSDEAYYYRDYQVSNVTTQTGNNGGIVVTGKVKNSGTSNSIFTQVLLGALDSSGQIVDAEQGFPSETSLAPGQSSPFRVELPQAKGSRDVKVAVFGIRR